jgi:hypothetical protein
VKHAETSRRHHHLRAGRSLHRPSLGQALYQRRRLHRRHLLSLPQTHRRSEVQETRSVTVSAQQALAAGAGAREHLAEEGCCARH